LGTFPAVSANDLETLLLLLLLLLLLPLLILLLLPGWVWWPTTHATMFGRHAVHKPSALNSNTSNPKQGAASNLDSKSTPRLTLH
jgi:hypothetical protein